MKQHHKKAVFAALTAACLTLSLTACSTVAETGAVEDTGQPETQQTTDMVEDAPADGDVNIDSGTTDSALTGTDDTGTDNTGTDDTGAADSDS